MLGLPTSWNSAPFCGDLNGLGGVHRDDFRRVTDEGRLGYAPVPASGWCGNESMIVAKSRRNEIVNGFPGNANEEA